MVKASEDPEFEPRSGKSVKFGCLPTLMLSCCNYLNLYSQLLLSVLPSSNFDLLVCRVGNSKWGDQKLTTPVTKSKSRKPVGTEMRGKKVCQAESGYWGKREIKFDDLLQVIFRVCPISLGHWAAVVKLMNFSHVGLVSWLLLPELQSHVVPLTHECRGGQDPERCQNKDRSLAPTTRSHPGW